MTFYPRWHGTSGPQLSPEVAEIMDRHERELRRQEDEYYRKREARRREHEAAARTHTRMRCDPHAPVRQIGQTIVTKGRDGGDLYLTIDEFRRQRPDVPPPPSIKAKPGIGLVEADVWRTWVWAQPFNKAAPDWNEINGSYPSDPEGCCRHKASYLRARLGGRVIFGRRTDKRGAGPHAVLEIEIEGKRMIIDEDRCWDADRAPFVPVPIPWVPHNV